MPAEIGKEAPVFSADAYCRGEERRVQLRDYRGRWVLLFFYLRDFTPVWPTELAAVAVKYPAFQELGSEVLAVSVDSLDTHRRWQEGELTRMVQGGALFPLCSDPRGEIGGLYGVFDQDTGLDARGSFLIDPEGNIQWIEISATAVGRNVPEILRVLRALQHQRTTGAMLPCGWQPGRPSLPAAAEEAGGSKPTWEIWETRNAF